VPPFVVGKQRPVVGVVGNFAGVVGAVASMIEAVADVDEEVIDADWICASSMVVSMKLLRPVVQMIWPTVNTSPSATTTKLGMMTIWLA